MLVPQSFTLTGRPSFIVFEGVNGAGKSTLIKGIAAAFDSIGRAYRKTFEPGDTKLGAHLRTLLLTPSEERKCPKSEIFLFAADRAEHVDKVIEPSLAEGRWVLCDRYIYSTMAFQGYGRKLDHTMVDTVNAIAVGGTLPALVILIDLDPLEGLKRTGKRQSTEDDAFEAEDLAFHQRIRDGFLAMARERPEPFLVLDGMESPEVLLKRALAVIGGLAG